MGAVPFVSSDSLQLHGNQSTLADSEMYRKIIDRKLRAHCGALRLRYRQTLPHLLFQPIKECIAIPYEPIRVDKMTNSSVRNSTPGLCLADRGM